MLKKLLITFCSLVLAACSSIDTPEPVPSANSWEEHQSAVQKIQNWDINGKIGIVTQESSNSASLKWRQESRSYQIDIHGPLGQGGASIQGSPGNVTVDISGEGSFAGPNPEFILYQQLGWDIPISNIYWWIRGLPAPGKPFQYHLENNRLKALKQNGWDIQYLRYNNLSPALPSKLKLTRNGLKITLIVHSWVAL